MADRLTKRPLLIGCDAAEWKLVSPLIRPFYEPDQPIDAARVLNRAYTNLVRLVAES